MDPNSTNGTVGEVMMDALARTRAGNKTSKPPGIGTETRRDDSYGPIPLFHEPTQKAPVFIVRTHARTHARTGTLTWSQVLFSVLTAS